VGGGWLADRVLIPENANFVDRWFGRDVGRLKSGSGIRSEGGVLFVEPGENVFAELEGEFDQPTCFLGSDLAGGIILSGFSLGSAGVEVVGIVLAVVAQNMGKGLKSAVVVGEVSLGAVAGCLKQDGAELEGRIVGDPELPVRGEAPGPGIGQIAIDDGEEIADL